MPSTSFNSRPTGSIELLRNTQRESLPVSQDRAPSCSFPFASTEYEAQARRMKAYAGQLKFQAPVSDDFSRGMLADPQVKGQGTDSLNDTGLINCLTSWWRRRKLD